MAEAVEKVGWRVALGFAWFDFTRDEWLQRSSLRPYAPSGQGFGFLCWSLSYRRYMKPASGQEISHYAPAEEVFNSLG